MKNYYKVDAWSIVEEGFDPDMQRASESIFSLGNGRMGQRANFEETYSGKSLQGNYVGGVYYPDKTRVGWWKNGYPEYFAKVLNAANWIGLAPYIGEEALDLATASVSNFRRELNMRQGVLERSFTATTPSGKSCEVAVTRFLSMKHHEAGCIRYRFTPLNFSGSVTFKVFIDGDVQNQDSNYDEKFWTEQSLHTSNDGAWLSIKTKKLDFEICAAQRITLAVNGDQQSFTSEQLSGSKYVENALTLICREGELIEIHKYAAVTSTLNHDRNNLASAAEAVCAASATRGFEAMLQEQREAWEQRWSQNDIVIEGDDAAQQAIRFNIFHLHQTYTGDDHRLNIGPKGFTGEKYGGSTYWDTEAYCLPFYMLTCGADVARNLLKYRYAHLPKAIENAAKLGFTGGAALYPMVTMNGEECHNEWEITFEEIHRNGAIAYAIYNYILHTGDQAYLEAGGLEVLLAISRFWSQRVSWSERAQRYMILGVTGPNEYENNVNNNWYTNYIARWTLQYTSQCLQYGKSRPGFWKEFVRHTHFNEAEELKRYSELIELLYLPQLEASELRLQQDGFLDKEDLLAADLPASERPINQHWSWDRILRSVFIKQADVLQGMYFFESHFSRSALELNFDFYEPRTVHESSLSPCVHAVLAARLGKMEKAYEMYLRTARLDLDDYNKEVHEGLHITSMAGTWLAVIEGFGQKRVRDGLLSIAPALPDQWQGYSFKLVYRSQVLSIVVARGAVVVENQSEREIDIFVYEGKYTIQAGAKLEVKS